MIRFITITGADDSVNPDQLVELSQEFPFVEWGILVSIKQTGNNRFPSKAWLDSLENAIAMNAGQVNLSLHLCGSFVRDFLKSGASGFVNALGVPLWNMFNRVQINTHGEPHVVTLKSLTGFIESHPKKEFIFQLDEVNESLFYLMVKAGLSNVSGLFDKSHGAGLSPNVWPAPYCEGYSFGYAGGIGPDNLLQEMDKIRLAVTSPAFNTPDFWVDMETKVRTKMDTQFNLVSVRKVLEMAKPWFAPILPKHLTVGQETLHNGKD